MFPELTKWKSHQSTRDAVVDQDSTPGAQFLAEVAARGSRGWVVAAVGAAAAGVALLGLSARRGAAAATPVPV